MTTTVDLFQLYGGIGISTPDLTSSVNILQGIGSPAGSNADAAPSGSIWLDSTSEQTDSLNFWWKWKTGAGLDKWTQAANTSYVQATAAGLTWRAPVVDLNTTITATANLPTPILPATQPVVDGVTVPDGGRVLFAGLTDGAGPNVYVWSQGSWVDDSKHQANGDALFVQGGAAAEQEWVFDGTSWFQFGGSSNQEISNIRLFVGKDAAGATYPNYVSNDIVSDGLDLRLAVSQLDDAIGLLQFTNNYVIPDFVPGTIQLPSNGASTSSVTDITDALNLIDSTFGNGSIINTATHYPLTDSLVWAAGGTLTITTAFNELNTAIGNLTYSGVSGTTLTTGQTVTASLNALNNVIGPLANSSAYTNGGFLSTAAISGNSVQQTFDSVNVELGVLANQNYTSVGVAVPVSTNTPLEPVGAQLTPPEATDIEWSVQVKDSSGKRQSFLVHAITDGTNVDFTQYAIVKTGGNIGGSVGFSVDIDAGNIVPSLTTSEGAGNLTATIKRISYSYLA